MRIGIVLLLSAGIVVAQGRGASREPPPPELVKQVRKIVGDDLWGQMPEWRRRNVVERYQRYRGAPEAVRTKIEQRGMREFLTRVGRPGRKPEMPAELVAELKKLDPKQRRLAGKIAFVRLRQLRFDRNLALLPAAERRRWFLRLFPEPFDPAAARQARLGFEKAVARSIARRLKPQLKSLEGLSKDEWRKASLKIVRAYTRKQEEKLVRSVAKEVQRLRNVPNSEVMRRISGDAALVLDRQNVYATPRQRELIRWALRPEQCPLLDFSWMGERPREKGARRAWSRDIRVLGRLELLSEAGMPKDTVLHLASAGSEEDFLRALQGLLGRDAGARQRGPAGRDRDKPLQSGK